MGVINDFRDSHSFIDYQVYGNGHLKIFDASLTSGQDRDDAGEIHVFLNFKKVGVFKAKQQALALLEKLIHEAPKEARADFIEHQNVLLGNLR